MSEWKEYRLGDIADIKGGKRLPKGVNLVTTPNNHPYIRIRDFDSNKVLELNNNFEYVDNETQKLISRYIANTDDILLSIVGTIGLVAKVGSSLNNANLTENCVKINNLQVIDSDFLYYYLVSSDGQNKIKLGTVGAVQPKLPIKNISDITIPVPSFETQHSIASFLSALDNKIVVNRRICENLEAQAQALFKHWFIDFAPFKNGNFVESELGMIPEGWRVGSLFDIAEVHDSKRKPLSGMERAKMKKVYPYYGATEQMDMVDDYIFDGRYVLMGEDGSVVRENGLPYIQYVWGKIWVNNHAHVLTGKNGFTTEMLIPFLTKYNIKGLVTGAVQAKLNQANMAKIRLAIPPMSILEKKSRLFESLYDTYRNCCTEMVTLSTLRDALLPKLMSGQIKV